jgi:large subunit ribosomal protein L19e
MKLQKRLGAAILKCSPKRVWLNPEQLEEIKGAITKFDVRRLIAHGLVKKVPEKGISRIRAKKNQDQRRKGRRKGLGSRKGVATARTPKKESWMNRIRPQRELLKRLKEGEKISNQTYRTLYSKAKGGYFRSARHMKLYMEEHNLFVVKK